MRYTRREVINLVTRGHYERPTVVPLLATSPDFTPPWSSLAFGAEGPRGYRSAPNPTVRAPDCSKKRTSEAFFEGLDPGKMERDWEKWRDIWSFVETTKLLCRERERRRVWDEDIEAPARRGQER